MAKKNRDISEESFGRLAPIRIVGTKGKQVYWLCRCKCGRECPKSLANLTTGRTQSCGCRQGGVKHGLWGKPGYKKFLLKDPVRRLKHNVGVSVRDAIKAAGGSKKGKSVFDFLPYTPDQLRLHLETQWESWMNWQNYGGPNNAPHRTWHIDHILPQNQFSFSSLTGDEFLKCWSLNNLRPLERTINLKRPRKNIAANA